MRGISISNFANSSIHNIGPRETVDRASRRTAIPEGMGAFEYFFKPVLDNLKPLYWLGAGTSTPFVLLRMDNEALHDSLCVPLCVTRNNRSVCRVLFRPQILPAYARYMQDDWVTLIGLEEPESEAQRLSSLVVDKDLKEGSLGMTEKELIIGHSPICFVCVDGVTWEMYSKHDEDLSAVKRHLEAHKGFKVRETDIHKHFRE